MALVAKYTEQVSLVISKELRAQIDEEAEYRQVSIGTVVREALETHYRRLSGSSMPAGVVGTREQWDARA
jgi:hypothetical protein